MGRNGLMECKSVDSADGRNLTNIIVWAHSVPVDGQPLDKQIVHTALLTI